MTKNPSAEKGAHDPKPHETRSSPSPQKPKGAGHIEGMCLSASCKTEEKRFGFCEEHYEQFKFGLIKKTGEPVSDYEKKFEHYQAYKAKKGAQKVA